MIEVIVGCMFPMLLTPSELPVYKECYDTKVKVEYVLRHSDLVYRYFKEEDILRALGIIYCESSGKAGAVGINTNGTQDVGLWQFNDNTWAWLTPKLGIMSDRTNPEVSTAVASWLVYNDGWHHWNSSKNCWKGTNNEMLWLRIKQSLRSN
tara:strand:- start:5272 stop:5724 length:453 start_codon:yes stop_codon:yes gene_type:complete